MIRINLTETVKKALKNGKSFRQTYPDLKNGTTSINVPLEIEHKVLKALRVGKGTTIKLTKKEIKENIDLGNLPQMGRATGSALKIATNRRVKKGGFLPALLALIPTIAGLLTATAAGTATAKNVRDLVKGNGLKGQDAELVIQNLLHGLNGFNPTASGGQNVLNSLIPLLSSGMLATSGLLRNSKGGAMRVKKSSSKKGAAMKRSSSKKKNAPKKGGAMYRRGMGMRPHGPGQIQIV